MTKKRYDPAAVRNWITAVFVKNGYSRTRAADSASVLVEADMRGIFSHGVNSLDNTILPSLRAGGTMPRARCVDVTKSKTSCIRHLDAGGGPGHSAAFKAIDMAKKLARQRGMARVFVHNVNHFGAAGIYSERISAEKDLEGRAYCNTSLHERLPGGNKPSLGTNPMAWSFPYNDGIITIDMATTVHAASGVCKAIKQNYKKLPCTVLDKRGRPTTDPAAFESVQDFLVRGSLLGVGAQAGRGYVEGDDVGYKGRGLGILIALMCATGVSEMMEVNATIYDERRRVVHVFEASRIDTAVPLQRALDQLSEIVAFLRERGPEMLLPGQKEAEARTKSLKEGIPYEPGLIRRLVDVGKQAGVPFPR